MDPTPARESLATLTISEASLLLREKKLSPVELTEACLRRIEQLNSSLNAFITVTADSAMKQAREAEREIQHSGSRGPLHGIPIALKDLVDTAGVRTTAASALFKDRVPAEDAEIVQRLKNAGAVLVGKTNLHEFAYGGSSMISHFGAVRNPRSPAHITGGSSGGSAAAVATGMCFAAIGTDTAGSIREPAGLCGIVGLKPTYGLVSARGIIPLAWSYDHVGPMARTIEDAALMLQAIAGYDPADVYSRHVPVPNYAAALNSDIRTLRVGVPREGFLDGLDSEVEAAFNRALETITSLTSLTREVTVPTERDRTAANCESYAYHARNVAKSPQLYQPSTLARIITGESVTAPQYIRAIQELERIRRVAVAELFTEVDVLVTPTTPAPAPTIAELKAEPDKLRAREVLLLRNTRPFNVLGIPAISVPCGVTSGGLPIGLQVAAAPGRDDRVLAFAHAFARTARHSV